jgi:heme exporter protein C
LLNKKRLGLVAIVVAALLILLTTYLALFFAPIPQTSVEVANKVAPSVEGSRMQVAGFIGRLIFTNCTGNCTGSPAVLLADFSDYSRYTSAVEDSALDQPWWTIQPLIVEMPAGVSLDDLVLGTNLSAMGEVKKTQVPPSFQADYALAVESSDDVTIGGSSGEYEIVIAPISQKIFYFHMPSAWVCYVAFFVTLVGSILYLRSRNVNYDRLAFCSAELGVLFATLAITTGPIWAKEEWGVYWRWDDTKLVSTFILWLVYIGYLSLRAAIAETGTKARVSAVYGIIGFVTVPMSFLSSRVAPLIDSSHPEVIATSKGGLSAEAGITIGIAVVAFTILYTAMLIRRLGVAESADELEEIKREIGGE